MTTLVVGATGATGRLLVRELLERAETVRIIVRSPQKLPESLRNDDRLQVVHANLLDLTHDELARHVADCDAVASCLGHTLSFRGIFLPPWRLVTEAVRRLGRALRESPRTRPARFVLMSSAGVANRDLDEPVSLAQRTVIGLLRLLVAPHADNERAADLLRSEFGSDDPAVEWAVVRPDTLTNDEQVTDYEMHPSPTRSAIFDPGKTSRVNVAHLVARLITDDALWDEWSRRMPVVYNAEK